MSELRIIQVGGTREDNLPLAHREGVGCFVDMLKGLDVPKVALSITHNQDDYHREALEKVNEDEFLVNVWAGVTPEHTRTGGSYSQKSFREGSYTGIAWGEQIQCQDSPMASVGILVEKGVLSGGATTDSAVEIVSPEGTVLGALYNRYGQEGYDTLAIYFDLVHYGRDRERIVLAHIIDEVEVLLESGEDYSLIREERKAKQAKERLAKKVAEYFERAYNSKLSDYHYQKDRVEEFKNELARVLRKMREAAVLLASVGEDNEKKIKDVVEQIEALPSQYKVLKVEPLSGGVDGLNVFTDDIIIETEEYGTHYIGRFRIEIKFDSSDIRLFNLNNKRRAFWSEGESNHPHVGSSGQPCWGSVAETVAMLHGDFQFIPLVNVIISYLENVNTDDVAGRRIYEWGDTIDADAYKMAVVHECEECGCEMHDDDDVTWSGDHVFCSESCRDDWESDNGHYCERCGEFTLDNDGHYDEEIDMWFCDSDCRDRYVDRYYTSCENCGSLIPNDDSSYEAKSASGDTYIYCSDECREEEATECEKCGDWIIQDDEVFIEEAYVTVCSDECRDEYIDDNMYTCAECGELVFAENSVIGLTGDPYCSTECRTLSCDDPDEEEPDEYDEDMAEYDTEEGM